MNKASVQFRAERREAFLSHGNSASGQTAGANPVLLEDLIHELRQPLGVIDSLAYYLQLRDANEKSCIHLRRIREMVLQAGLILERAGRTAEAEELELAEPLLTRS
jgi:signal transduction histidine kinase